MKEKVKLYDKEINRKAENIKNIVILLAIFFIGYITGYIAINMKLQKANDEKQEHIVELEKMLEEKQVKINEQYVELDSLRETVYMYNLYGK